MIDYRDTVHNSELIWRLGRWIGRRESGAARLTWSEGELILRVHIGKIVSVEGIDPANIAERMGCEGYGKGDLLEEARAVANERSLPETQSIGTAKELVQEAIHLWLRDPARGLDLVDGEPDLADGPTISITHAIVELVLADTKHNVHLNVLPDLGVLLRRTGNFLDLYAPLRLSEDADLIVAKITGQRTAEEIASRSPHNQDDVLRLLGALVATGMLEPIPVVTPTEDSELIPDSLPEDMPPPKRLSVGMIAVIGVALALVIAFLGYKMTRIEEPVLPEEAIGQWTLVVDMGCEPDDLQRVLTKANAHSEARAIRTTLDEGDECWRLVWGEYPSQESAQEGATGVPASVRREGFEFHVIELPSDESDDPGDA